MSNRKPTLADYAELCGVDMHTAQIIDVYARHVASALDPDEESLLHLGQMITPADDDLLDAEAS